MAPLKKVVGLHTGRNSQWFGLTQALHSSMQIQEISALVPRKVVVLINHLGLGSAQFVEITEYPRRTRIPEERTVVTFRGVEFLGYELGWAWKQGRFTLEDFGLAPYLDGDTKIWYKMSWLKDPSPEELRAWKEDTKDLGR